MKKLCMFLVLLTFLSCKKMKNENLTFTLLEDFTLDGHGMFDGRKVPYYSENYIVKGFSPSGNNISKLDSVVCDRYQASTKNHHNFQITFYKETKRTNVKELRKNERELARYSDMHDKLYEYSILRSGDRTHKKRYKMQKRSRVEKSDFICDE